jgi:hypothetical protein
MSSRSEGSEPMTGSRGEPGSSSMDRTRHEHRWEVIGLGLLVAIAVLMLATVSDYGLSWDAEFHVTYGEYVLAWFESGFQDKRALSYKNSYVYGAFFDVLAQLFARLSPLGVYEDRHLVNVAFGILALAGTRRLGAVLLGARGGALAMGLTVLTPMFYGHSFNNPKDIPFAALFVWTLTYLYESARPMPGTSRWATAKLSICFGAMLAIRPGGIFFLAYIVIWWSLLLWRAPARWRDVLLARTALVQTLLGAWVVMLTCWPWGQVNPIIHPLAGIVYASRFSYAMTTLFLGEQVPAQRPPLSYLPVWFGVQLPEIYFVAGAAAVAGYLFHRRRSDPHFATANQPQSRIDTRQLRPGDRTAELVFLSFVVLFPIATAMVLRSTLYDGVRHLLFVIPPLAVLAAAGIESGLAPPVPRAVRALIASAAILATALTIREMIVLHPYQSTYFNRLFAGGLAGANGRFETDYWGNSYREAIEWVVKNVPGEGIRVANCSSLLQTSYYLRGAEGARFISVLKEEDPDLLLATTRWDCHRRPEARVLHTVERHGVPLAYVLDLRR